jgi:hypothetical protein
MVLDVSELHNLFDKVVGVDKQNVFGLEVRMNKPNMVQDCKARRTLFKIEKQRALNGSAMFHSH